MKILFYLTLSLILMYSLISMAKPGFYLLSLSAPQEFVMELGQPFAQRSYANKTEYLYRAGTIKPFCMDYQMTFVDGQVSKWIWHFCTMASPTLTPLPLTDNPL